MNVILFGATGMVGAGCPARVPARRERRARLGQGVLRECLRDESVERVLAIVRRSTGLTHPKLGELVRRDLFDVDGADVDQQGFDAYFFCLGVSAAGMSEGTTRT
jgi:hypothetical protein